MEKRVMKRLDILIITSKLPYPPTDGGREVVFQCIARLAARGHRITLLCFGGDAEERAGYVAKMEEIATIRIVRHNTRTSIVPALLNMFSSIPYTVSKYRARNMHHTLTSLLESQHFDLAHIEPLHMAHYIPTVKMFGVPVMLRLQNVESVLVQRVASVVRGPLRLYLTLQAKKLKRFEAIVSEQADLCLAISEEDATQLRRINPQAEVVVIPAGTDTEYFKPRPEIEEPYTIVYVGYMNWLPNLDAVLWFCHAVFPQICQRLPEARLLVVGKNPPDSVRRLHDGKRIIVTGFVNDVRDYIAKGSVFVVPLRAGGGIRIKILQAMSMGKAIVSTSVGAEGIKACPGRDLVIADTADEFARSVIDLLLDRERRQQLGQSARELIERQYSWEIVVKLLEEAYLELVRKTCL